MAQIAKKPRDPENRRIAGIDRCIDCNGEPVEIIALADLHIGDKGCNRALIQRLIDSVRERPNRYAVLVGDLMNTAIIGSKSDSYNETLTPMEALQTCVRLFEPIKHKILAIVPGNHEERISRSVGVDMTRLLATQLGLDEVYSDTTALVFVHMGKNWRCKPITYSLYITHGTGGGRRPAGKLNSLVELAQVIDTDIYICGHTHLPATLKTKALRICPQSACAIEHELLFVNTASALDYGGYGRRGGYTPASNSYPVITLDNKTHHMTCTV